MNCKKRLILMAAILFISPAVCRASIILDSVVHTVWGTAGYNEYHESDSVPVSGSAEEIGEYGWGAATSTANEWNVSAWRSGFEMYNPAMAYAENIYSFSPLTDTLRLSVSGSIGATLESQAVLALFDHTDNIQLEFFETPIILGQIPSYLEPYNIFWEKDYSVDPLHDYILTIYVTATRGEGGIGQAELNVAIIPEPVTFTLLALGAALAAGKKFT